MSDDAPRPFGRTRHPPPTLRRGFTLVELLLVLVIISVFAGMAVVSFKGRRNERAARAAAADVCAALRYAAMMAETKAVPHRVTFDAAAGAFQVESWEATRGEFQPARGLPGRPRPLPERVRIARIVPSPDAAAPTALPPPPIARSAAGSSSAASDAAATTAGEETGDVSPVEFGPDGSFAGVIELVASTGERAAVRVGARGRQIYVEP